MQHAQFGGGGREEGRGGGGRMDNQLLTEGRQVYTRPVVYQVYTRPFVYQRLWGGDC